MLTIILTDGIQAWFNSHPITPEKSPDAFHQLIQDQKEIGWSQLFNRKFANEWHLGYKTNTCNKTGLGAHTLTGQTWTRSMITKLWTDKNAKDITNTRHKFISQIKHLLVHTQQDDNVLTAHISCACLCATRKLT
jgi:hypothetical protein